MHTVEIHTAAELEAEEEIIARRWPEIPENVRRTEAFNRLTFSRVAIDPDPGTHDLARLYRFLQAVG